MNCHFSIVTWGDQFTDLLLKVVLPNQLTPGNLGYFKGRSGSRYRIYTTKRDAERIENAPIVAMLASYLPVEVIVVSELGLGADHHAAYRDMTRCHQHAIAEAEAAGAAMILLPGDAIWSEGSFRRLWELCEAGYAAVLIAGIRLVYETYVDAFIERFYDETSMQAKADARALVEHALPHLHPLTQAYRLDSPEFISFPSHLIWPVEGRGFLLKAFHMHPAIIKPMKPGVKVSVTVDHDYLKNACPDPDRIYVVEDSDEILQVAVDRSSHRSDLLAPNRFNLTRFTEFAKQHTEEFQRQIFLDRTFRVHTDQPGPVWQGAQKQANLLVDRFRFAMRA